MSTFTLTHIDLPEEQSPEGIYIYREFNTITKLIKWVKNNFPQYTGYDISIDRGYVWITPSEFRPQFTQLRVLSGGYDYV